MLFLLKHRYCATYSYGLPLPMHTCLYGCVHLAYTLSPIQTQVLRLLSQAFHCGPSSFNCGPERCAIRFIYAETKWRVSGWIPSRDYILHFGNISNCYCVPEFHCQMGNKFSAKCLSFAFPAVQIITNN